MREHYVFGSLTAGDPDRTSDVDVLVVTDERTPTTFPAAWSVYSYDRIRDIHRRGTLFAWHLYEDAVLVFPREQRGVIELLGRPAPYSGQKEELRALLQIGHDVLRELEMTTPSPVYELGLLYVVARDVAMVAAQTYLGRFTFSRFAPFEYHEPIFPLPRVHYMELMACRHASTRRGSIEVSPNQVRTLVEYAPEIVKWCETLEGNT